MNQAQYPRVFFYDIVQLSEARCLGWFEGSVCWESIIDLVILPQLGAAFAPMTKVFFIRKLQ